MGKKQKILLRLAVYALGTVTLALGIVLNTKTGMGTSAIISVPYAISVAGKWDLGRVTFFFLCVLCFDAVGFESEGFSCLGVAAVGSQFFDQRLYRNF